MTDISKTNFADDVFLTRGQLCERLQVTVRTLCKWHETGKAPPSVKVGGAVRYPEKFLGKWLEARLRDADNAA